MPKGFVSFKEVKRAVSMVTLLVHYDLLEGLTRKGKNLAGPCPFCEGQSSRQFQVDAGKGAWYCFGCKRGGNVLDFVCQKEGVKVREAARLLDEWFGLDLAEDRPPQPESRREDPSAATKGRAAPSAPSESTSEAPPANPPLTFTLKTLNPTHPDLMSFGISAEVLERLGAGYCSKGLQKGRLAVPIHDGEGALVAYAGLALSKDHAPHTLFPPKFRPDLEVFGLHLLGQLEGEPSALALAPDVSEWLRYSGAVDLPLLALFDGTLSAAQEAALAGVLAPEKTLLLVGEGFADQAVARLARLAFLFWLPSPVAAGPLVTAEAAGEVA